MAIRERERIRGRGVLAVSFAAAVLAAGCGPGAAPVPPVGVDAVPPPLTLQPIGRFDFAGGADADRARVAEELSGLAWLGDSLYLAVSDQHAWLHTLVIRVDPSTGAVTAARFDGARALFDSLGETLEGVRPLSDREGLVVDAGADRAWIAQERVGPPPGLPAVCTYRLSDGRLLGVADRGTPGLEVFGRARPNLGFESLTRTADGAVFWTANEEALEPDGPTSSARRGTVVRLVALDRDLRPIAQFAYPVDPHTGPIRAPASLAGRTFSGVSDLLAVDGALLVLERMFAGDPNGMPQNRNRIYEVDLRGATDVSRGAAARGLAGRAWKPVGKRLLAEITFPFSNSNFEGIAAGIPLQGGGRIVLMIADNNAGTAQALFALRLTGDRGAVATR